MTITRGGRSKVRARLAVGTIALGASAASFACSSNTVTGGGLMVAFSSDMSIPKDVDTLHLEITQNGVTRFEQDYQVGPTPAQTLPATLLVLPPSEDPSAPVQIRVVGLQSGTPRVLRDAVTVVPSDRVAELRMPVAWLCEGSAESGPTASDGTATYAPKLCTASDTTCAAGACVSSLIDSTTLPGYSPPTIFGGASEAGAGGACFDTLACFAAGALAPIDLVACDVPLPPDGTPNVAIVVGRTGGTTAGICGDEACLVPLDGNSSEGWQVVGATIHLPPAVCTDIKNGQADGVLVTTACATKTDQTPTCGAWSSTGSSAPEDAGQSIDLSDGGEVDAPIDSTLAEGDATTATDGASDDGTITDAGGHDATLGDASEGSDGSDAAGSDGSSASSADGGDAGSGSSDGGTEGGEGKGGGDAGGSDSGASDSGVLFLTSIGDAGTNGELYVLTSDGYATLTTTTDSRLWAAPIDGGPVQTISTSATTEEGVVATGPAAFWTTNGSNVLVWSSAYGLVTLEGGDAGGAAFMGASADGNHVGFTYTPTLGGTVGSVATADLNGSNLTELATNVFSPVSEYFGNTFVASYSATADGGLADGGTAPQDTNVYANSSTTQEVSLPTNTGWSLDANGDLAFVAIAATGEGALYTVPGNVKTHVDSNVAGGLLTQDGTGVVYLSTSGALWYAAVTAAPQPVQIVPSGVTEVLALSPDGSTVAYCSTSVTTNLSPTDLWISSAKSAGTPKHVVTSASVFGFATFLGVPTFTADSAYVLYLEGTSSNGTLSYAPVTTGVSTSLGLVGIEYASGSVLSSPAFLAPTGSLLVYANSSVLTIEDLSTAAKTTYNLFGPFGITSDNSRVVFAGSNGSGYGLYSAPLAP